MRKFLIAAILVTLIILLVVASPLVDVRQSEEGTLPSVEASGDGIRAEPGEMPSFEVETGSVKINGDSVDIETAGSDNIPADEGDAPEAETPSATP